MKVKNIVLTILASLFGLMMLNSGLNKFLQYMHMPPLPKEGGILLGTFAGVKWMFPLIALVEIVGGILIAIPKTRALGAIIIFPVMVGILMFHIAQASAVIPMTVILFSINLWAIEDNWKKYLPMVQ